VIHDSLEYPKPSATFDAEKRNTLRIEVQPDATAASRRAAAWIAELAQQAIERRGRFVLAISGGGTPREMLGFLATEAIDWRRVELLQVDERVAPWGSPDRNLTQLRDILLTRIPLPAEQFHAMLVEEGDLAAAAERYGQLLARLGGSPLRLDLVHLGLGADGHTASLVPGSTALDVTREDVALTAAYQGRRRMTLTLPAINRARHILWLITGEDKAATVERLVQADPSLVASRIDREPALLLADRAAAGCLESQQIA
jgi:6-phosphogluconolactonase